MKRSRQITIAGLLAAVLIIVLVLAIRQGADRSDAPLVDSVPSAIEPLTGTPTGTPAEHADARSTSQDPHPVSTNAFSGTDSCRECHRDRYDTYAQTSHSRSLRVAAIDPTRSDNSIVHEPSKRSYDVFVSAGQLRHREWEHFRPGNQESKASDPKLLLTDLPVQYVMGSGSFAEAYLLRDGDYLLQSPVTWYVADDGYGMAPGYDVPVHYGCNRVIEKQCLFCHAGQVDLKQPQHPRITELAIGCERCHGPSQSHVQYHQQRLAGPDVQQAPLAARSVNPATLERSQLESICAQCHLNGDVVVDVAGKDLWDFVPGEELSATRLMYRAVDGQIDDPFTQHFDQMWNSKCYQQSETLTCVSCHDPHHDQPSTDPIAYYRDKCFGCHDNEDCGVPLDTRRIEHQNDCSHCHLPKNASAAVHSATTNHRIGVHRSEATAAKETAGQETAKSVYLRRLQPSAEIERHHNPLADTLAVAYWLLENEGDPVKTRGLDAATIEADLLNVAAGKPSGKVQSMLARLADFQAESAADEAQSQRHSRRALTYAQAALADQAIAHVDRVNAVEVLSDQQYQTGDYEAAAESYRMLISLRRSAIDHYNFGLCLGKLSQFGDAESQLREAMRIDPSYPLPYRSLAVLYRSINPQLSSQLEAMADQLFQNKP